MAETRVVITAEANQAIQEFNRLRAEATGSIRQIAAAGSGINQVGVSAAQTAAVLRQVPAQFTDIVVSLQAGQAPLTVLLQQGGQLRDMFANAGVPLRALGGYLLGLVNPFTVVAAVAGVAAVAYNQGSKEADAYTRALIMTGNAAGTSASQMADMAREISQTVGTQGAAATALAALAETGKVSADNLKRFGAVAVNAQENIGQSVADTAKDFAELGKAPLQASEKLGEKYNYLTAAVYTQIKALQDQGRMDDAATIAQEAYSTAIEQRSNAIKANLGTLEGAWKSVGGIAKSAWDYMLNIGRENTVSEQIAKLQEQIDKAERKRYSFTGGSPEALAELQALRDKQALLQSGQREEAKANAAKAAGIKLDADKIQWLKDGEKYLSRSAQLEIAITKARNEGAAAQQTEAVINQRISDIRKGYSDIFNDSIDSQIEAIKRRGSIEEIISKRSLDTLTASREAGLVTETDYMQRVAAMNIAEFDRQKFRLQQELTLTAGKQNSLKDQAALRGQIAAVEENTISRQLRLENDLFVLRSKTEKDVFDQILQSTALRNAANDSLAVEYSLYGKNADAREIALIAVKAQADQEKYIYDQRRAGKVITDEMIGQLSAETAKRVEVTQATLAQSKALNYAGQLKLENEKFAAESILDEKDRAAALLAIDAKLWTDRITQTGEGTEAQRLLHEQYATWYANQTNKPMIDQWRESVKKYDDIFRQGFADMANNGKSAWASFTKSLATTFKTSVADQIYKMFAQPFVMKLVASLIGFTGGVASGVAGAAESAGSGVATGLGMASMGAAFGSSAMAGLSAAWGAGGSLATTLSSAVAGATAAPMASLGLAMGALAPIALGLGAAIAAWKSMDTSGTYHTGGASSATSAGVNTIRAESLNFEATRVSAETEKMTAALASGIVGILDSAALAFGKTAGYTAATAFADDTSKDGAWGGLVIEKLGAKILDWQDTKTGSWAPKTFSDGAAGQAEYLAALSGSVRTALDGIGLPSWAASMLDAMGSSPTIEQLTATVNTIVTTQKTLAVLGQNLIGFANISDEAASTLMAASGGISAFTTNVSAYYDKFYSADEKAANATKQMSDALAAVGLTLPKTDADFRALVESQMKLGAAGAKSVAVLMANAGAFADLTSTATTANTSVADARSALSSAYDAESSALKTTAERLRTFRDGIMSFRDSLQLGSLSTLTPMQKAEEAKRQYDAILAKAKTGDAAAQSGLQAAATAYLTADQVIKASSDAYAADAARVQADLAGLADLASAQATDAELQLTALNAQVGQLITLNSTALSVVAAIQGLGTAMGPSGSGAIQGSAGAAVSSLYQSLLGRTPEASGMANASDWLIHGGTVADLMANIMKSQEYLGLHGSHADGLTRVPFNNYRANLHEDEVVVDAPAAAAMRRYFGGTGGIGNNAALVAEIKALRDEVAKLRTEQQAQTGALISSNFAANNAAAEKVASSTTQAAAATVWAEKSKATIV